MNYNRSTKMNKSISIYYIKNFKNNWLSTKLKMNNTKNGKKVRIIGRRHYRKHHN